jgi:hypothetical protein
MNFSDFIAGMERWNLRRQGKDATYTLHDGTTATLRIFIRRQRADDLFAAAFQQDVIGVFNANEFVAAFPARITPARFDRVVTPDGRTYSVEESGGAPIINPTFFKVLLRGGQQ